VEHVRVVVVQLEARVHDGLEPRVLDGAQRRAELGTELGQRALDHGPVVVVADQRREDQRTRVAPRQVRAVRSNAHERERERERER